MEDQQEASMQNGNLRDTDTIFIVEDDPAVGSMLSDIILQETSHYPVLLTDGLQVLKLTQHIKPCLFLIDYYLPKINGLELYDQLYARKELRDIPAIIIDSSLQDHQHAIEERGIIALSKPFELDEFLITLQAVLARLPERPLWHPQ